MKWNKIQMFWILAQLHLQTLDWAQGDLTWAGRGDGEMDSSIQPKWSDQLLKHFRLYLVMWMSLRVGKGLLFTEPGGITRKAEMRSCALPFEPQEHGWTHCTFMMDGVNSCSFQCDPWAGRASHVWSAFQERAERMHSVCNSSLDLVALQQWESWEWFLAPWAIGWWCCQVSATF